MSSIKKKIVSFVFMFSIILISLVMTNLVKGASTTSFSVSPNAQTTIINGMNVGLDTTLTIDGNDSTDYGDFVFEIDKIAAGNRNLADFTNVIIDSSSIPAPFILDSITDEGDKFKIVVKFDYAALGGEPYSGTLSINFAPKYSINQSYVGIADFKMSFNGQLFTESRNVNIVAPGGSRVVFSKWSSLVLDSNDNHYLLKEDASKNIFYLPINYSEIDIDYLTVTDTRPTNTEYTEASPYPSDPMADMYNYRGIRIYKVLEWQTAVHSPAKVENATRDYEQYMTFDEQGNFKFNLPDGLTRDDTLIVQYALAVTSDPEVKWKDQNTASMTFKLVSESFERTATFSVPLKPLFLNSDSYSFYKKVDKDYLFVDKTGKFIEGQELEYTLRIKTYEGGNIPLNTPFIDILDSNVVFVSTDIDTTNWNYSISGNNFNFTNNHNIGENSYYEFKIKVKVLHPDENYVINNVFSSSALTASSNTTITTIAQGSSVRVEYVDTLGNALVPNRIIAGFIGDSYSTEEKQFDNWHLKEVVGNTEGILTETQQIVRYIYERDQSSVVVEYVDTDGNKLADPLTIVGFVGDEFVTEAKVFAGWQLREVIGESKGVFSNEVQGVKYVYEKKASSDGSLVLPKTGDPKGLMGVMIFIIGGVIGAIAFRKNRQN